MTTQLDLLDNAWCERMLPFVLQKMAGREFTFDDVHTILPEPPEHDNLFGVLAAMLRRRAEKIGYRASKRPEANGRVIAVWRIRETKP